MVVDGCDTEKDARKSGGWLVESVRTHLALQM